MIAQALYASPNPLASHYSTFRVSERLLLTGHSHQAWPDVGFEGQKQAWLDAAEFVDRKWEVADAKRIRVGEGYREMMGGCTGDMTLDANTHALLMRFLSALPLRARPRIVTTDGEFHTIRRQVDRLAEEGIEVVKVAAEPLATVAERVAAAVDNQTACVLVSSVFFETGFIVPGLEQVGTACERHGAEMLVDAYHSLNVVPFSLDGIDNAFVVGGGYKYCQLGEANCVLRIPEGCEMRPVVTGWFSEFADVADARTPGEVRYGKGVHRFAGSTFDPTSQYRGAAVLDFFADQGLTVDLLREVSQHQVGLLLDTFHNLDLDRRVASVDENVLLETRAGFLAVKAPNAERLCASLLERGVSTDYRGDRLRFGPAPYLSDTQIVDAMQVFGEVARRPTLVT